MYKRFLILMMIFLLTACSGNRNKNIGVIDENISALEESSSSFTLSEQSISSSENESINQSSSQAVESSASFSEPPPQSSKSPESSSSATSKASSASGIDIPQNNDGKLNKSVSSKAVPVEGISISSASPKEIASANNDFIDVENSIIKLINDERERLGLNKLTYDSQLSKAAYIRCKELYSNNYFAHTRPNGDSWSTVLKTDIPVEYSYAGENLAKVEHNMPDYKPEYDASYWYETWENSPTHYENMIRPEFTDIAVRIYYIYKNKMNYAYAVTIFKA